MALLCLGCAGVYAGSLLMSRTVCKKAAGRLMTASFASFFAVYCLFLLSLTLFGRLNGRGFAPLWENGQSLPHPASCNLIPFHSIFGYFDSYFTGKTGASAFYVNFFGNIAAFMPFAFFLPFLFPRTDGRKTFLLLMTAIVSSIELLQLVLGLGECDIDDVILNVGGAWALFELLRRPRVRMRIGRLTGRKPSPTNGSVTKPIEGESNRKK